ncbi:AAA family ATPase [Clostridium senegalense]|uniref:AAA family ATPase n=1 Tax=Clostridium senegalense TaxID=1465809 RepID=A0A6M0H335_9CLOT|nr:AAA family ATPase [Clostridium senegalense]
MSHPILTTKMTLNFDEKNSKFILKPYNNITNAELDFLTDINNISLENVIKNSVELKSLGIDVKSDEEVIKGIKYISDSFKIDFDGNYGKFTSLLDINDKEGLFFYNEPIIIFRKVDTRLWNVELNSMIEHIKNGGVIPKTIEALVKNEEVKEDDLSVEKWNELGEDLLFPLPYNEEQKDIVKRISENFGVVVQGPPGTGKSHTIVNLICHLLAHGKRVLVTSQTDRALRVLNNKIPDEIRSLCMSILGDDAKAMDDLDNSVRKITENLSLDTLELKKQFKFLRYKLKECRANQEAIYEELKKIEENENLTIEYNGDKYTLMDMAQYIREHEELNYIDDNLCIKDHPPINEDELNNVIQLLETFDNSDLEFYEGIKGNISKLPNLEIVIKLMTQYIKEVANIEHHNKVLSNWSDKDITSYNNSHLINLLDDGYKTLCEIENTYVAKLMKVYHGSNTSREFWDSFLKHCKEQISEISNLKAELNKSTVELPSDLDFDKFKKDFKCVDKVINEKGKVTTFFKMLHGNVKYILEDIKVNYNNITSKEQVEVINMYIKLNELERDFKNYFNNGITELDGVTLDINEKNYIVKVEDAIQKIEIVTSWDSSYKDKILNLLKAKHFSKEINLYNKDTFSYIKESLISLRSIKNINSIKNEINNIVKELRKYDVFDELSNNIEKGNVRFIKAYNAKVSYVRTNAYRLDKLIMLRDKMLKVCPKVTKYMFALRGDVLTNEFVKFHDAFKYKVFYDYIIMMHVNDIMKLEKNLHQEKIVENNLVKEIVSKQSWYNQIQRTTESQKRSLFAWMESIKRIGKGTGAQAIKYRKMAQKEMEKCKDVIPVWIMPINRVIENLQVNENLFDVIIVDESSQSDITALTTLMRAERAVIVGDEKQISPEAIGKDAETVEKLIETYLKDIPDSQWFDLKTSLYTTALRVFPNRLVLKEHFRSVEDIIGFSNSISYSNEIIPLRCSKNDNPLKEPLKATKIDEAFRDEKKSINLKEAYAIVDKIEECLSDKTYENMTIGVISLLGDTQAEVIENLLVERIGMEEMVKRNIVCGDAYSFQGDERDVIFLTLVIANNVKYNTLAKESDIRRFNVAASRARNQMWLFHSVDLEDLNPKCIRYKLLDYCMNYKKHNNDNYSNNIVLSDFEEDVLKKLEKNNFKVTPKVKVGKYDIDFMVDAEKRIAVECVGGKRSDKYSWKESLQRQHTLERVGWKFYKLRSSEFYLNPEVAFDKLEEFVK